MANKREFKKYVETVSSSICEYMMEINVMTPDADHDAIENAMIMVLTAAENAVMKSNIKFDKGHSAFPEGGYRRAREVFYKSLFKKASKEYKDAVEKAIKNFNKAIPAEVKERNKASL